MLGAALDLPSIGVTRRPLVAGGPLPEDRAGARPAHASRRGGRVLGADARGVRPIVAHAAWRTTADDAADVVIAATHGGRLPEPLRLAIERARALRDGR